MQRNDMQYSRIAVRVGILGAFLPLNGCAAGGAPSFILFGAYFPGWMLCALLGVLAAIAARIIMVGTGLANTLPYQLFVCLSVGAILAVLLWLLWFGR